MSDCMWRESKGERTIHTITISPEHMHTHTHFTHFFPSLPLSFPLTGQVYREPYTQLQSHLNTCTLTPTLFSYSPPCLSPFLLQVRCIENHHTVTISPEHIHTHTHFTHFFPSLLLSLPLTGQVYREPLHSYNLTWTQRSHLLCSLIPLLASLLSPYRSGV